MTKPTIGRIVLYHPPNAPGLNEQPCAAIICGIRSDINVNLAVFDSNGVASSQTGVLLYQGGGERPGSHFAEWPPYQSKLSEQAGQSANAPARERELTAA